MGCEVGIGCEVGTAGTGRVRVGTGLMGGSTMTGVVALGMRRGAPGAGDKGTVPGAAAW